MSSGAFVNSIYQMDAGTFASIRVQPETLQLSVGGSANAPGAGPVDFPLRAKGSKTVREYGLGARGVTIKFPVGGAPTGYKDDSPITLPVLTQAVYNAAVPGAVIQYLGSTAELVGRTPERLR